jgi:hypothetical protein
METENKRKDPDSFSLDPDNPEPLNSSNTQETQNPPVATLSPITNSPRLRRVDSFSQDDVKAPNPVLKLNSFPPNIRMTLGLCKCFNKESKTMKKINELLNQMDENSKQVETAMKREEKRIDEFFQEIYEQFCKNFARLTETYKQGLKRKLQ